MMLLASALLPLVPRSEISQRHLDVIGLLCFFDGFGSCVRRREDRIEFQGSSIAARHGTPIIKIMTLAFVGRNVEV